MGDNNERKSVAMYVHVSIIVMSDLHQHKGMAQDHHERLRPGDSHIEPVGVPEKAHGGV